jgi:hypothetical protein
MEFDKIVLIAVSASAALGALILHLRSKRAVEEEAYVRRRPLKSYEQTLYWRLVNALPDHVVLAQVAMNRCITMRGPHASTLGRETLDFVLCNRAMRIQAVIEVEDESLPVADHRAKIRQLKEEALAIAGIRFIRCSPNSLLSEGYITMEFKSETAARLAA